MNKGIAFPRVRRNPARVLVDAAPRAATGDAERVIRLWELAMSGERASAEYQRLEALLSRRTPDRDPRRPIPLP